MQRLRHRLAPIAESPLTGHQLARWWQRRGATTTARYTECRAVATHLWRRSLSTTAHTDNVTDTSTDIDSDSDSGHTTIGQKLAMMCEARQYIQLLRLYEHTLMHQRSLTELVCHSVLMAVIATQPDRAKECFIDLSHRSIGLRTPALFNLLLEQLANKRADLGTRTHIHIDTHTDTDSDGDGHNGSLSLMDDADALMHVMKTMNVIPDANTHFHLAHLSLQHGFIDRALKNFHSFQSLRTSADADFDSVDGSRGNTGLPISRIHLVNSWLSMFRLLSKCNALSECEYLLDSLASEGVTVRPWMRNTVWKMKNNNSLRQRKGKEKAYQHRISTAAVPSTDSRQPSSTLLALLSKPSISEPSPLTPVMARTIDELLPNTPSLTELFEHHTTDYQSLLHAVTDANIGDGSISDSDETGYRLRKCLHSGDVDGAIGHWQTLHAVNVTMAPINYHRLLSLITSHTDTDSGSDGDNGHSRTMVAVRVMDEMAENGIQLPLPIAMLLLRALSMLPFPLPHQSLSQSESVLDVAHRCQSLYQHCHALLPAHHPSLPLLTELLIRAQCKHPQTAEEALVTFTTDGLADANIDSDSDSGCDRLLTPNSYIYFIYAQIHFPLRSIRFAYHLFAQLSKLRSPPLLAFYYLMVGELMRHQGPKARVIYVSAMKSKHFTVSEWFHQSIIDSHTRAHAGSDTAIDDEQCKLLLCYIDAASRRNGSGSDSSTAIGLALPTVEQLLAMAVNVLLAARDFSATFTKISPIGAICMRELQSLMKTDSVRNVSLTTLASIGILSTTNDDSFAQFAQLVESLLPALKRIIEQLSDSERESQLMALMELENRINHRFGICESLLAAPVLSPAQSVSAAVAEGHRRNDFIYHQLSNLKVSLTQSHPDTHTQYYHRLMLSSLVRAVVLSIHGDCVSDRTLQALVNFIGRLGDSLMIDSVSLYHLSLLAAKLHSPLTLIFIDRCQQSLTKAQQSLSHSSSGGDFLDQFYHPSTGLLNDRQLHFIALRIAFMTVAHHCSRITPRLHNQLIRGGPVSDDCAEENARLGEVIEQFFAMLPHDKSYRSATTHDSDFAVFYSFVSLSGSMRVSDWLVRALRYLTDSLSPLRASDHFLALLTVAESHECRTAINNMVEQFPRYLQQYELQLYLVAKRAKPNERTRVKLEANLVEFKYQCASILSRFFVKTGRWQELKHYYEKEYSNTKNSFFDVRQFLILLKAAVVRNNVKLVKFLYNTIINWPGVVVKDLRAIDMRKANLTRQLYASSGSGSSSGGSHREVISALVASLTQPSSTASVTGGANSYPILALNELIRQLPSNSALGQSLRCIQLVLRDPIVFSSAANLNFALNLLGDLARSHIIRNHHHYSGSPIDSLRLPVVARMSEREMSVDASMMVETLIDSFIRSSLFIVQAHCINRAQSALSTLVNTNGSTDTHTDSVNGSESSKLIPVTGFPSPDFQASSHTAQQKQKVLWLRLREEERSETVATVKKNLIQSHK